VVGLSGVVASAIFRGAVRAKRTGRVPVPLKGKRWSGVIEPSGLQFGWVLESLHYYAELFGFFL
jgi:hypothetical protein